MKKVYESPLNGWGESAERIHIYALESDDEYWKLNAMSHEELCEYFDVIELASFAIAPGSIYYTYDFHITSNHVMMIEEIAYNV